MVGNNPLLNIVFIVEDATASVVNSTTVNYAIDYQLISCMYHCYYNCSYYSLLSLRFKEEFCSAVQVLNCVNLPMRREVSVTL